MKTSAPDVPGPEGTSVTLSTGRVVELRAPKAGELRGVKLLDLLQLDPAAHAVVLERTSDLTALEFYELTAADALALMGEVAGFFAPSSASQKASTTPGP